jgi:hypothetical protein
MSMDTQLDQLLAEWTQTLLGNLEDPTTRENLHLLKSQQRQLVDNFLRSRSLPETIDKNLYLCHSGGAFRFSQGSSKDG